MKTFFVLVLAIGGYLLLTWAFGTSDPVQMTRMFVSAIRDLLSAIGGSDMAVGLDWFANNFGK